ncbi:DUF742 domain-containing protein [Arthrobacter sp. SLBN-53]|uniref:DUF742 domain-containing protein n=1 Tax=Arthrobacter sp. SLBN-53 TaxID=2768412 RepID=UPI00114E8BF8|nr:DUF742 domain-containing protein [Arthrobacter sp. SLBN-53]TQK30925.1 uncharacterized protein DUF742 [Arthrobacter sp. SLBN-53]
MSDDVTALVRPYTLTGGRTTARLDLPLEAPIQTVDPGPASHWPAADVRSRILTEGRAGPSVAEIAARLELPLGVARVLIGDLAVEGYVRVRATLGETSSADERRDLIGRTLRGLRAL